jgi:aspartyl-tRNA(Asn)/glutamyl-tRNA(Gln) amidotransferase subunit A
MSDSDLVDLSVSQAVQALRVGQVSSQELTQAYLRQIDRLEGSVHAFITLTPELALAQAQAADGRLAAARRDGDANLPPLLGLPVAVKDLLVLAGVRCTCGSRILENYVPPFTATSVQRLLDAGVVVLGKTNTDEFAMGSSTENSAFGPTYNPWEPGHVPGGSSGGSAAAVAARMAPAAMGTDTGGSVRQPAAFCGVTGIKPSYGRVSRYGLVAYGSSLDTVGALGRSVEDVARLFQPIAGHDPLDATSLEAAVPDYAVALEAGEDLRGVRIGVPSEYFVGGVQPEVAAAVRSAIETLASLGAEVQEVSLPHTEYALPVYYILAPAEASANLARYDGVRYGLRASDGDIGEMFRNTRGQGFGAEVKRRIMLGTYALSAGYYDAYYAQAQKVRTLIRRDFEAALRQVDVIAAPVAPSTALRLGEHRDDPLAMYLEDVFTLPANLAGVPSLAFPVGFDAEGLPIGMQLMGPVLGEERLFHIAAAYQRVSDWHLRKPAMLNSPELSSGES